MTSVSPLECAFTKTAGCHSLFLPSFRFSLSSLAATLMHLPASVANKRLTDQLNPLNATLTKNTGEGSRLWLTRFPMRKSVLRSITTKDLSVFPMRKSVLRSIATKDLSAFPMRIPVLSERGEPKDLYSHAAKEHSVLAGEVVGPL